MTRISTTPEDEEMAVRIVASHIGAEASRHDDGSGSGRHDFWLHRDGERIAALEVTSFAREDVESLDSALDRHGRILDSESTSLTWLLDLAASSNVKLLIDSQIQIEELLTSLEADGVHRFVSGSNERAEVVELGRLGISAGLGVPAAESPQRIVFASPPGIATWTGSDWTNDAVRAVARRSDNVSKLSHVDVAERHLFMWVFFSEFETWLELLRGVPPPDPPDLPPEITDVWIACEELFGDEGERVVSPTVWHAHRGGPWHVIMSPRAEPSDST